MAASAGEQRNDENEPWLRFDLGRRRSVHRIEEDNRSDCCAGRAVPLVVELSDDGETYRQVARRDENFLRWSESFPRQRARYVRLRVEKKTAFHLERVVIR